ncbi:hypothetical protein HMPREF9552_02537, partial [Escherichia coli MS 198-1]
QGRQYQAYPIQAYSAQSLRSDKAFTSHPTTGTNATIKKWH